MAITFFNVKFRGRKYELDLDDLTNMRLIKMKEMFGKEYGTFDGLPRLMGERDSAAWACALWIGAQKHGYPEFDPREMDFFFDEFEFIPIPAAEEAEAEDPKADDVADVPIPDSPSTASSDSEASISTPSSKPAVSPRRK